ncbi:MAG: FlgO family outer membrane protein [candidate division Zixibacteria bacterium]|nr:FlgO family outer membrane protein [candidate division Zixibacteria bacterium]MDH3936422.1 FlgO family outer membrane protein [candidate division Zixibacteria bacterium]MDH4034537.1 FlgO family outer membrane protein [candidate division Zixibacteria bacterium]
MTNGCNDQRFETLLHAYELGFLSEDERAELEMHMLDCSSCFEKAQRLAPTMQLIKSDPEVREAVDSLDSDESTVPSDTIGIPEMRARRSLWRKLMPTSIAAAAVLALLVFKPWKVQISTDEAVAQENRLAVMYFENLVDEADSSHLGEIATNLLITDLSESRFIQVVSSQHLHDLLKLIGNEDVKIVDKDIATQIARKARAKWILTGKILQSSPGFVVTAQIVDVSSGNAVASQRVTGAKEDDIFAVVDKLTTEVKNDLSLPADAMGEMDPSVADVTTHSAEAYRHYLDGLELRRKFYSPEAAASFQKALEYDSTFAMAWYHLAKLIDRNLVDRAVQYADKVGRKEQYYIRSLKALIDQDTEQAMALLQELVRHFPDEKTALLDLGRLYNQIGDNSEAIEVFHRAVEIDPTYKEAFNLLAYTYQGYGKLDSALMAINRYIDLAPDEPNPYDSRGDIYRAEKMFDEAIESYQQALRIAPDFNATRYKLGPLLMIRGDFDLADSCFQWMADSPRKVTRSGARVYLALPHIGRGHLNQAIEILDDGIAADRLEQSGGWNSVLKYYLKALCYLEQGRNSDAIDAVDSCFSVHDRDSPLDMQCFRGLYTYTLAETGQVARSAESTLVFETFLDTNGIVLEPYYFARGALALITGDKRTTVADLQKSADWVEWKNDFFPAYFLARALLEDGQTEEAAEQFENLLDNGTIWQAFLEIWNLRSRLYLAAAYEKLGRYDDARTQCEYVLERWSDADPDLAIVEDARERLARLAQRP